ncbi:MAG: hypothetical protein WCO99_06910 [Planctomycetota bacterium]
MPGAAAFTGTTLTPGATQVGISFASGVTPNLGVINGSGATATFSKAGTGNDPVAAPLTGTTP